MGYSIKIGRRVFNFFFVKNGFNGFNYLPLPLAFLFTFLISQLPFSTKHALNQNISIVDLQAIHDRKSELGL